MATVTLRERANVNQEGLAFSPFRDGRGLVPCGLVPCGLVHALRRAVYPASQRARPRRVATRVHYNLEVEGTAVTDEQ